MPTAAPLPSLADLATVPSAAAGDEAIAAPWRRDGEAAFWFSRAAWALAALVRWRQGAGGRAPRLWLPGYFCNQSTEPARAEGAEMVFYPTGPDLEPDWDACQSLAGTVPPDLFVLVHFFGAAADAGQAADFCRAHGATLVEDAAHVLSPAPGIGEQGDAVLYSPRKMLAIPDGGLLLIRDAGPAPAVAEAAAGMGRVRPSALSWLTKRLIQKALPDILLRRAAAARSPRFEDDPPFAALPRTPGLSGLARGLLARAGTRLTALAESRRANALAMAAALDAAADCVPFAPAGRAHAPYRLVLEFRDQDSAARRFADWRSKGIPVETWPDLAPEVRNAPASHPVALGLRNRLLFLPVHQDLSSSLSSSSGSG